MMVRRPCGPSKISEKKERIDTHTCTGARRRVGRFGSGWRELPAGRSARLE
jgi:hypothetical protein